MHASMPPAALTVLLASALTLLGCQSSTGGNTGGEPTMILSSPEFQAEGRIPVRYTGDGEDVSPPLRLEGVPPGSAELVLICDDPDAPTPDPWVHWVVYGLAPGLKELAAGALPAGAIEGQNSWETNGYRGPAPPRGHGTHHYHFRLYALSRPLAIEEPGRTKDQVLAAMEGKILTTAELIGTYQR